MDELEKLPDGYSESVTPIKLNDYGWDYIFNTKRGKRMKQYKKNSEGYLDTTASDAIRRTDFETKRHSRCINTLLYICNLAGYKVDGRIVLIDKKSGRIWK